MAKAAGEHASPSRRGFRIRVDFRKPGGYAWVVTVIGVMHDLNLLRELAEHEDDPERRQALDSIRSRVADRDHGAKVSEVADLLQVSPPTVRSWMKAGLLKPLEGTSPIRIDLLNLAEVKRVVDMLRAHGQDRDLLAAVYRRLRDRDLLASGNFVKGMEDLRVGRVAPIEGDLRKEMAELDQAE